MTGLAERDTDLADRTDELVRRSLAVAAAAERQADELDRTIEALREQLWGRET